MSLIIYFAYFADFSEKAFAITGVHAAGRFIEKWAGEEILEELKKCFAHYEKEDVMKALLATSRLFEKVTRGLANAEGFAYPEKACECAKAYLKVYFV